MLTHVASCSPSPAPVRTGNAPARTAASPSGSPSAAVAAAPRAPDAGAAPGDDAAWASAGDSTLRAFELPNPRCLKQVGCPFEPVKLPPCEAGVTAMAFTDARDLKAFVGRRTTLRGVLRVNTRVTLADCGKACCNFGGGHLALTDETTRSHVEEYGVTLVDEAAPRAFDCVGDESAECCGFPREQEVLVRGRLVDRGGRLVLEAPRLCRFEGR